MSTEIASQRAPVVRKIKDLANDLILAQDVEDNGKRGRAIFLWGRAAR
jgi:hypothetical protein